ARARQPRAQQQLRGPERAAGEDDGAGAELVGACPNDTGAVALGGGGAAGDADGAVALEHDPVRLDAGANPPAPGDRPREVADAHRPLRVELAPLGARAALDAAAGVSLQRGVAYAELLGALEQELPVSPHALGVDGLDAEHLLGLGVVGFELGRPLDPV